MTEPTLRDLFAWLEAHRATLVQHAGALAEAGHWCRTTTPRKYEKTLQHVGDRLDRLAFELAAALESLERIHPRDPELDEDTQPGVEPPLSPLPRRRLTGKPA